MLPDKYKQIMKVLEYIDSDADYIKYYPGNIYALEAEKAFCKRYNTSIQSNMNKLKFLY